MNRYSLVHLSDGTLLHDLAALVARDHHTTASLLAHLAEVDARKLYLPAAYPSMFAWCVGELRLSEEAAFKRIRAARTAREYPTIFDAVADGRLNVSGIVMLAAYLTHQNANELLAAAAHRSMSELHRLLVDRFPRSESIPLVSVSPESPAPAALQLSSKTVETDLKRGSEWPGSASGPGGDHHSENQLSSKTVETGSRITPIAPTRYALHFSMGEATHDKLRRAQELLGHQVPTGDVAEVFDRALDALIARLEKRKIAATAHPRPLEPSVGCAPRTIPAHVRRAVWARDRRQCTFVSPGGRRCEARKLLEFDHVDPVARGGAASVDNLRLRCRAHNQYEAERTFGVGFMEEKRQRIRRERPKAAGPVDVALDTVTRDVIAGLRDLGFRAEQARGAAAYSETLGSASIEERLRAAIRFLCPKKRSDESRAVSIQ